ncbi:hypothetical protein COJE103337_10620 [Corynebacterium jeikeium]|nr:hypothetical protein HMPREF0297_0385 [Corynebacterium jeikeium ATCC 43734]WCZ54254.1 hypothetical protein CJEIK_08795 [Corynebacterium jeikeium]SQI20236.1 Uncharacterised protein [Corynebacterium jeikeium]SUY80440.1 Uncharacterised protein [Corynebacterium jeikeium]SUY84887.1 Uncharacterised protein [Corynebacterium jeikeium]
MLCRDNCNESIIPNLQITYSMSHYNLVNLVSLRNALGDVRQSIFGERMR